MTQQTLTRADLTSAVMLVSGLSRAEAAQFVADVLQELEDAIVRGDGVKIARFGNFLVREKRARVGRNPKTMAPATIAPRRVVTFRPSAILRAKVNRAAAEADRLSRAG